MLKNRGPMESATRNIIAAICLLFLLQAKWVFAQSITGAIPEITVRDRNNVDLLTHMPFIQLNGPSIGYGDMKMAYRMNIQTYYNPSLLMDNYRIGHLYLNQPALTDVFNYNGSEINFNGYNRPKTGNGDSLQDIGNGLIVLMLRNGTKVTTNKWSATPPATLIERIETPAGLKTETYYKTYMDSSGTQRTRRQSVVQNNGLQLKFNYNASQILTSVVAINNAVDYCDPTADTCTFTKPWPTMTFNYAQVTTTSPGSCQYCAPQTVPVSGSYRMMVVDQRGLTSYYDYSQNRLYSISKAGEPPVSYEWLDASNYKSDGTAIPYTIYRGYFVFKAHDGAMDFAYSWSFSVDNQYSSSGMSGPIKSTSAQITRGLPTSVNSEGITLNYDSTEYNRVNNAQFPFNAYNVKSYSYDDRGNITQTSMSAPGMTTLVETANFDAACANPVKCNKANWIKDANGNQTDYEYYTTAPIGFLKSVTKPVGANGFRPQVRYEYIQRTAWFKNASGGFVAGSPIWLISKESYCLTGNSCAGSNDEVVTTYDYGPDSGPNNLFLRGVVKIASDGQSIKSLRTCYGYDAYGHKISETAPKAHLNSCP